MSLSLRETPLCPAKPLIQWEETNCPLCDSGAWTPLIDAAEPGRGAEGLRFLVVRCDRCRLCFTNPRPGPNSIDSFYQADYAPHGKPVDEEYLPARRTRSQGRSLRKVLPLQGEGRLLDFGCGNGSYLLRMRRQGWTVTGVDASESAINRLRGALGLQV